MFLFRAASLRGRSKAIAINSDGVTVMGPDGSQTVLPAETVVVASVTACNDLEEALKERFEEVHVIGDASRPRRAHNATMDGHKIGLKV